MTTPYVVYSAYVAALMVAMFTFLLRSIPKAQPMERRAEDRRGPDRRGPDRRLEFHPRCFEHRFGFRRALALRRTLDRRVEAMVAA